MGYNASKNHCRMYERWLGLYGNIPVSNPILHILVILGPNILFIWNISNITILVKYWLYTEIIWNKMSQFKEIFGLTFVIFVIK